MTRADLRPLEPRYVSTVDSGNLAGHLLVLGNACASAIDRPLLDPDAFAGIEDALVLVGEAASALAGGRPTQTVTLGQLDETPRRRWPPRSASPRRARRPGRPASVSSPSSPTRSWTSRAR